MNVKRKIIRLFILGAAALIAVGCGAVSLPKTAERITIDGHLNEAVWRDAVMNGGGKLKMVRSGDDVVMALRITDSSLVERFFYYGRRKAVLDNNDHRRIREVDHWCLQIRPHPYRIETICISARNFIFDSCTFLKRNGAAIEIVSGYDFVELESMTRVTEKNGQWIIDYEIRLPASMFGGETSEVRCFTVDAAFVKAQRTDTGTSGVSLAKSDEDVQIKKTYFLGSAEKWAVLDLRR